MAPPESPARRRYRAYGVELDCDFPLPPLSGPAAGPGPGPTIEVRRAGRAELRAGWDGGTVLHEARLDGGAEVRVERGDGGEHLIRRGEHRFRLSGDLRRMLCAPPLRPDAAWESSLLDWAPYAAAVLARRECLHAGAVTVGDRVLAVAAPAGGGKSTLVAALVGAGARFFSDDVLALERHGTEVLAHPGAPFGWLARRRRGLAAGLGTVRAEVDGELWVEVADPATEPALLAAVVILDRRADGPRTPRFAPAGFPALRSLSIGFGGAGGGEARRLALLADLAAQAEVLRLEVDPTCPPGALAVAILARLGEGA